jgi:UDP-N-acetylglucosamine 2-epimerase (non-hydrolysing)
VLKVMTVLGTRPELIKMSRVLAEFDRHTRHVLVHTGQNFDYELNQVFFNELEIRRPDYFLEAAAGSAARTIGQVIIKTDEILENERPEALLVYGDTNSGLAVIAAKRRRIPVFHMEAGNRCFDQRVPEELNRKLIDHLSDINMVVSEHARRYLIAEGVAPETVIKTGSHMHEVLHFYRERIGQSRVVQRLGLESGRYFVVSAHREENVDEAGNLNALLATLDALASEYGYPVVVSTHPRARQRLEQLDHGAIHPLVRFEKAFGFSDYISLQMQAHCVLSDSGTLTEEAALLNLPAVALRDAHERPEGMDAGTLILAGVKAGRVLDAVRVVTLQHERDRPASPPADYRAEEVSKQVLKVVMSHVDYVRRTVWFRQD